MHRGPAQLLVGRLLAGGHLDQRRAPEEHLGPLFDHDHVVAHARHVGAPGGGVAEDQGDGGDGGGRVPGDVAEGAAARDEQLRLGGEVGAAGLGEADRGQPVGQHDVRAAGTLAERPRVHGATPDGRVRGVDEALDPFDHPDAHDRRRAHRVLGAPCRERAELEEGGVPVQEEFDPLPGGQLAALPVAGHVALAPAGPGHGKFGLHQFETLAQGIARWRGRSPRRGRWRWGARAWSKVPWSGRSGRTVSHRPVRRGKNRPMTPATRAEPRTEPLRPVAGVAPW